MDDRHSSIGGRIRGQAVTLRPLATLALALATLPAPQPCAAQAPGAAAQVAQAAGGGMVRRKPKPTAAPAAPIPKPGASAEAGPTGNEPRAVMSGQAHPAKFDRTRFRADPAYKPGYDARAQAEVYGGKKAIDAPRPLLELGHPLYHEGTFGEGGHWLGRKNPVQQQVLLYGDWRAAAAFADDGVPGGDGKTANTRVATRLNLDFDWRFTGTERLHFLFRPLDRKGKFTRYEFQGAATPDGKDHAVEANGNVVTGFLEGDLGAITQGISGSYNKLDLPFAVGLVPLQFQNGIWVDDAFAGVAATIPAMNSAKLDVSNMDLTFFAGGDKVSSPVLGADDHKGRVFGLATFAEAMSGYFEGGYGYLLDDRGLATDNSFHSITAAFTRRYGGWLSNSIRVLGAFGQQRPASGSRTANGALLLLENSLITRRPYTLIPYLNLFAGADTPQPLVRDPGAGGVLRNTGLAFEADALSGFPTLDASGRKSAGGAAGVEYLFGLDQQLVVEVAGLQRLGTAPDDTSDYGLGLRWQIPFGQRFIVRVDGIAGAVNQGGGAAARNISGLRLDLRVKF
jgi:hypothetical protein